MVWTLQLAALTSPGIYANKLKDVPVICEALKKYLLDNPMSGPKLVSFIIAETLAHHNVQAGSGTSAMASATAFVSVSFDSDEEVVAPVPPEEHPKLKSARAVCAKVLAFRFPEGPDAETYPPPYVVKDFEKKFLKKVDCLKRKLNEAGAVNPADATALHNNALKTHIKKLKNEIKQYKDE
jgi:hypothetical protein